MKKLFWATVAAVSLVATACTQVYDDSALQKRVENLEARVTAIEALNTTVSGISDVVNALKVRDFITSITELEDSEKNTIGYIFTFSSGEKVTLYSGKKGDQGPIGPAPSVTVQLGEDGQYYWVVEGELLKDAEGKPVPCTHAAPQFKIENGSWWMSYDGTDWTKLGVVSDAGTEVTVDNSHEDYVLLTINGTEVQIPKEKPFLLNIQYSGDLAAMGVNAYSTIKLNYVVEGATEADAVSVDIICTTPGISAQINKTTNTTGAIEITTEDVTEGKVVVYADNNKGKANIKSIVLEKGVIAAISEVAQAPAEGGAVSLKVNTNIAHHIEVPEYYDWVHVEKKTKADVAVVNTIQVGEVTKGTREYEYIITVDPNEYTTFRYVAIHVVDDATGSYIGKVDIVQKPAEGITTLYSIEQLPDETKVNVNGAVVVAVSKKGSIISDGMGSIYLEYDKPLAVGDSLSTLVGIKKTNTRSTAPYIKVATAMTSKKATVIPDTKWIYIGSAENYYIANTGTTALLQKDSDGYFFVAPENFIVRIEEPIESLNLESYVGKYVVLKGYMSEVVFISFDWTTYKSINDLTMIVNSVQEVNFTENKDWKITYDGKKDTGVEGYPEVVTNTVSGGSERYSIAIFPEKKFDEYQVKEESLGIYGAIMVADNLQYSFAQGGMYYSTDYIYEMETSAETKSNFYREFEPGFYYAVAAGVNPDGNPTGSYATVKFEVVDPHVKAAYEAFLGTWSYKSAKGYQKFVVKEKEKGSTYTIELGDKVLNGGVNPTAVYDSEAGLFTLSMQNLGEWENNGTVMLDQLSPIFYYSGDEVADNTRYMNGNTLLLTARMFEDGLIELIPGMDSYSPLEGFAVLAGEKGADTREYVMSEPFALPANLVEYIPLSEEYLAWVGNWTVSTNDQSYTIQIAQKTPNDDYVISGMNGFASTAYMTIPNAMDVRTGALYLYGGDKFPAATSLTLSVSEQTFKAYYMGLVEYQNELHPIGGLYTLGAGTVGQDGTATFQPGAIKFDGDENSYPIVAQRVYFVGETDPSEVYTLDMETVTYYPFTMSKAGTTSTSAQPSLNAAQLKKVSLNNKRNAAPAYKKVAKVNRQLPVKQQAVKKF